jgi:hypothetical protein
MFLHGLSSGWIGHQSSPQTDAPALNTCALLSGKNWAVSKATMSIRDKIKRYWTQQRRVGNAQKGELTKFLCSKCLEVDLSLFPKRTKVARYRRCRNCTAIGISTSAFVSWHICGPISGTTASKSRRMAHSLRVKGRDTLDTKWNRPSFRGRDVRIHPWPAPAFIVDRFLLLV